MKGRLAGWSALRSRPGEEEYAPHLAGAFMVVVLIPGAASLLGLRSRPPDGQRTNLAMFRDLLVMSGTDSRLGLALGIPRDVLALWMGWAAFP